MKLRNILILLFAFFFFACNNGGGKTDKIADTIKSEDHTQEQAVHEEHAAGLSLNNGAKWQTDESTRTHAAKLIAQVNDFNKKENAGLTDYKAYASAMQQELNSLVGDCKMKGADHEALHLWLEPVLADVSELKKATTTEEGKRVTGKLTIDVKKFESFFN